MYREIFEIEMSVYTQELMMETPASIKLASIKINPTPAPVPASMPLMSEVLESIKQLKLEMIARIDGMAEEIRALRIAMAEQRTDLPHSMGFHDDMSVPEADLDIGFDNSYVEVYQEPVQVDQSCGQSLVVSAPPRMIMLAPPKIMLVSPRMMSDTVEVYKKLLRCYGAKEFGMAAARKLLYPSNRRPTASEWSDVFVQLEADGRITKVPGSRMYRCNVSEEEVPLFSETKCQLKLLSRYGNGLFTSSEAYKCLFKYNKAVSGEVCTKWLDSLVEQGWLKVANMKYNRQKYSFQ